MKKILAMLLAIIMLCSTFAIGASAQSLTEQVIETTETTESKLTEDLQEYLASASDDEYIPIYIWLNDYGDDIVYTVLSNNLGKAVTASTEESYIASKVSAKKELLTKGLERLAEKAEYKLHAMTTGTIDIKNLTPDVFRTQANVPEIMTNAEIEKCIESGMSSDEIITLSERTQFLSDYRNARKSVNGGINENFYKLLDLDECKNVYVDKALPFIKMECTKNYIYELEDMTQISMVGLEQEVTEFSGSSSASTYAVSGGNYEMTPHNTLGYDGTGVKVGVLEVTMGADGKGVYYDTTNPHLSAKAASGEIIANYDYSDIPADQRSVSQHATGVLSVLCGEPVTVNGKTYQGIAPNATVYYYNVSTNTDSSIYNSLYSLAINDNVSAINMSWNSSLYLYDELDIYIDCYIQMFRIAVVCAAGNNIILKSPAWAYNLIAVGNVSNGMDENGKYLMNSSSACSTAGIDETGSSTGKEAIVGKYLPNKPDVSAFGTNIVMVNSSNVASNQFAVDNPDAYSTGTSLSAPMVTGTIALMIQSNQDLLGKPDAIKTILVAAANEDAISPIDNDIKSSTASVNSTLSDVTGVLRAKSGAGLLDIDASIRLANTKDLYRFVLSSLAATEDGYISENYYFDAGTTIEIAMTFEKSTHSTTSSIGADYEAIDLEIQLINSNGAPVFTSTSRKDNVEVFKCLIKSSDTYRIRVVVDSMYTSDTGNPIFLPSNGEAGTYHSNHFDDMYVSFLVTCGCTDKNIGIGSCDDIAHTLNCSNSGCNFSCWIRHQFTTLAKYTSEDIILVTELFYLFPSDVSSFPRETRCFELSFIGHSNNSNIIVQKTNISNKTTTLTSTGEIQTYSLEAQIEQDGTVKFVTIGTVTITIDYYNRTIILS